MPILPFSLQVADTTGAGDAYLAGAHAGLPLTQAGRRACSKACCRRCRRRCPAAATAAFLLNIGTTRPQLLPQSLLSGFLLCMPLHPRNPTSVKHSPWLPTCPAGFLFYMLLSGGLNSLVADPGKVSVQSLPGPTRRAASFAALHGPVCLCLRERRLSVPGCTPTRPGPPALRPPVQLRRGVEFATACGAFTCTKPGAIGAQPTVAEAEALLAEKGQVAQ